MLEMCETCHLITPNITLPSGVRLYRSADWSTGSIRIVALRRLPADADGRYAKGFCLPFEYLEDMAGNKPVAEQLKDPLVEDEIDRLTILAIDSVVAGERRIGVFDAVELEHSPRQKPEAE